MSDSTSTSVDYNVLWARQFQFVLLTHLVHCENLLRLAAGKIKLTDFELPICQAIWEALERYYTTYRSLPPFPILALQVLKVVQNVDGAAKTFVAPDEYEGLTLVMDQISRPGTLNEAYCLKELKHYLLQVRGTRLINSFAAGGPTSEITELTRELAKVERECMVDEAPTMMTVAQRPGVLTEATQVSAVTTGCQQLNRLIDGGLQVGDLGMITACPGRGKSNILTHFTAVAAMAHTHSLLISLELSGDIMRRRFIAMAACIDGVTMKRPVGTWKEVEQRRLAMMLSEGSWVKDFAMISDLSGRRQTLARIEKEIEDWKEYTAKTYGSANACKLVCVDWLDRLIFPHGENDKTPEWRQVALIGEDLKYIATRQQVAIWTATQGNKEADQKTFLGMDNVAFAYHKNDPLDIGIGIGIMDEDKLSAKRLQGAEVTPWQGNPNDVVQDKKLVFNINKYRHGSPGYTILYQAPNLRFYDDEETYQAHLRSLNNIHYNPALAAEINRAGGDKRFIESQLGEIQYEPFIRRGNS